MIENTVLRLILTTVFLGVTGFHLLRVSTADSASGRVSSAWQAGTALTMAIMLWSWGRAIPPALGAFVFGGAAAWFVYQVLSGADEHPSARRDGWYHAGMGISMVWMWALMAVPHIAPAVATADAAPPAEHAGHAVHAAVTRHEYVDTETFEWHGYVALGLGVLYLIATVWFGRRLIRAWRGGREPGSAAGSTIVNLVTAAGMGLCFLTMA